MRVKLDRVRKEIIFISKEKEERISLEEWERLKGNIDRKIIKSHRF